MYVCIYKYNVYVCVCLRVGVNPSSFCIGLLLRVQGGFGRLQPLSA